MQKESVVVFDEAHNIDNLCIEALSVSVRRQTLEGARRNLNKMRQEIEKFIFNFSLNHKLKLDAAFMKLFDMIGRFKATDAGRLRAEYNWLVEGLAQRGNLPFTDNWLSNPALPDDILKEAVPGNIRRAQHFLHVLRRLVQYLEGRLETDNVEKEGPVGFVASINTHARIDQKTLKFCYDHLHSLMLTLEITDTDEFLHIQTICDFPALVGTYTRGFSIIIEPFDERMAHIPDPVLQLSCHDASLAIKPVFDRFQSVVITSGTLSPIDLYPRQLNFHPVVSRSFTMSLTRDCICPMVLTRGSDQLPVRTKFDMRSDLGVVRNYGRLLLKMASVVPDGIEIMQHKFVFIEIQDVVETTLALDNYRKASDCGRGAIFFSVASLVVLLHLAKVEILVYLILNAWKCPKPRIDYTLKAVGGSLTAIPGISDMIDDTVNTVVTDMLQWPHRIIVPISGIPVDTSELELKPQGKITLTIIKANDLKSMEMIGKSDPYVVVHIRPLFTVKTKKEIKDIHRLKLPSVNLVKRGQTLVNRCCCDGETVDHPLLHFLVLFKDFTCSIGLVASPLYLSSRRWRLNGERCGCLKFSHVLMLRFGLGFKPKLETLKLPYEGRKRLSMEKTVDFEENMVIQKELEMLFGCSASSRLLHGSLSRTQLEQLGLFIKDDDDNEQQLDFDGEEGEIFS
uniref:DNA 5'-3' helicase n=1 Tax=Quercus lobata TaxID=97700 RepID=A0A7N2M2N3_QUELO